MSIKSVLKTTYLEDSCSADEAETLLAWLLENPNGSINLKKCTHMHTAILQVLMVFKPKIRVRPQNEVLDSLLYSAGV